MQNALARPVETYSRPRARLVVPLLMACALTGCATSGIGRASLAPASEGVVALGDGLIGQAKVKLPGEARAKALEAEFQALQFAPAGQEVPWVAGGFQGSVVPTQLYRIGSQDCRGYSHTVLVKGQPVKQIGTACRAESGLWQTVV